MDFKNENRFLFLDLYNSHSRIPLAAVISNNLLHMYNTTAVEVEGEALHAKSLECVGNSQRVLCNTLVA